MNTTTNMGISSELWLLNEKWIIFESKERKKEKYVAQQRVYLKSIFKSFAKKPDTFIVLNFTT